MMSRLLGIVAAPLAVAAASPLHAAPAAVTYHIERYNHLVTVKDANEKTLTTFSAATPTLQGLFTWSAANPPINTPRTLTLTLKDQNGKRLWSSPVPVAYPQNINVSFNTNAEGTQLAINTVQDNPSNSNYPPASGLVFVVGANGRPMSFGDGTHQFRYVYEANRFSVVDKDGKTLMHGDFAAKNLDIGSPAADGLHLSQDGTGTMQINGTSIAIDKVTKDGKTYQSFPWNGHKVFIEQDCNWNVTTDGDLTINAPSIDKTTASK
jgi:hypothetical protein